jgi:hypothetical protein
MRFTDLCSLPIKLLLMKVAREDMEVPPPCILQLVNTLRKPTLINYAVSNAALSVVKSPVTAAPESITANTPLDSHRTVF